MKGHLKGGYIGVRSYVNPHIQSLSSGYEGMNRECV